jgi:hypothetical protein
MAEDRRAKQEAMIAGLLRKAESAGPEEAEALTEAAAKFMLKYGIDEANLQAARLGQDRTAEKIVTRTIDYKGVYSSAYVSLSHVVVEALGQMKGFSRKGKGSDMTWVIVGYERDVDNAITLLTSLALQAVVAVDVHIKNDRWWTSYTASEKYNVKRSFLMGFGVGASTRIREAKRVVVEEASVSSPGTELVLVNRAQAVELHVEKMFPNLKSGRSVKVVVGGYDSGHAAGKKANTGGTQLANKKGLPR